jgi:hypothetical protein
LTVTVVELLVNVPFSVRLFSEIVPLSVPAPVKMTEPVPPVKVADPFANVPAAPIVSVPPAVITIEPLLVVVPETVIEPDEPNVIPDEVFIVSVEILLVAAAFNVILWAKVTTELAGGKAPPSQVEAVFQSVAAVVT